MPPASPLPSLTLRSGSGVVTIHLFGAHITSYIFNNQERTWVSSLSDLSGNNPIRGGVPIAFPQFADSGDLPLHGFARVSTWTVGTRTDSSVTLTLDSAAAPNEWTERNQFTLEYTVSLSESGDELNLSLAVANTGSNNWSFTGCLHTYFLFAETSQVELHGLGGAEFTEKCSVERSVKMQEDAVVVIPAEARKSGTEAGFEHGFVDRIYHDTSNEFEFKRGGDVLYTVKQSPSWPDTTVYNPWLGDKQGTKGPDFDDDGYTKIICLEPTVSHRSVQEVEAGGTWVGWQSIKCGLF